MADLVQVKKQTLHTATDLALATSSEAETLKAAAAAATVPLQQEVKKVETGLGVVASTVQQNVTDTTSAMEEVVRYTALALPPLPNPVENWNKMFERK